MTASLSVENREKVIRYFFFIICELFTAYALVSLICVKRYEGLPIGFITLFLLCIPEMTERFCACKIVTPIYLYGVLSALFPLLNALYMSDKQILLWNIAMRFFSGFSLALLGMFIFLLITQHKHYRIIGALSIFLFSLVFTLVLYCTQITAEILWANVGALIIALYFLFLQERCPLFRHAS